jgi:membrane-associated phospholipid phosphatase
LHRSLVLLLLLLLLLSESAFGAGGPLGIDHNVTLDNDGVTLRRFQLWVEDGVVLGLGMGALWYGGESRIGSTYWRAVDAAVLGGIASTALKATFTRSRPIESGNPNDWFAGKGHYSFPSGEVTLMSAAVTPFILEYKNDHPSVWALELLPAYDAIARLRVGGHWQTDVLAGFALGSAAGYIAHQRDSPFILEKLPHGFMVGVKASF